MNYQFIKDHQDRYEVDELCEAFALRRSSYYRWKTGIASARSIEDTKIKEHIVRIYKHAKGRYGYRPIYHHLKDEGLDCGRDRTLRLMNQAGIAGVQKRRFKALGTQSDHRFGCSANLLRLKWSEKVRHFTNISVESGLKKNTAVASKRSV